MRRSSEKKEAGTVKKGLCIILSAVFISFSFAEKDVLTEAQQAQLAVLSEILQFLYEDNSSAFPADANEISALGETTSSRDMLILAILQMMKDVKEGKMNLSAEAAWETTAASGAATTDAQTAASPVFPEKSLGLAEKEKRIQELVEGLSKRHPDFAEDIRIQKEFRRELSKFLKRCSAKNSLVNQPMGALLFFSKNREHNKPCLWRDGQFLSGSGKDEGAALGVDTVLQKGLLSEPNEPWHLAGEHVWEGTIFLDRPVYVYDTNGVPGSLMIREGSRVVPLSENAGIYLIEGSALTARKVYFGPLPEYLIGWQGIFVKGRPSKFLFDENEVRAAEKGLFLEDYGSICVSDTVFKWCMDGLVALPGTVLIDNCVFDDSYWTAVSYYMETIPYDPNGLSDPNGPADPNGMESDAIAGSGLYMDNCTITGSFYYGYAHDYGVFVHGTKERENAGRFEIRDCLITSSCVAGIHQEGWQSALWQNNAFFHNISTANPGNPFEDSNSIWIPDEPYYDPFHFYVDNGYGQWDMLYFLWPESGVFDAGSRHIFDSPLIGKTTLVTGQPDIVFEDIGYHYPHEDYYDEGIILKTDVNGDHFVNLLDFAVLARDWRLSLDPNDWPTKDPNDPLYYEPNSILDVDGDLFIGLGDLVLLSEEWLLRGTGEEGKGMIVVKFSGEPLSTTVVTAGGLLDLTFEFVEPREPVVSLRIERDGEEAATIDYDFEEMTEPHFYEKTWRLKNQARYVFRALMADGDFITSRPYSFEFDNGISVNSDFKYCLNEDTILPVSVVGDSPYILAIFNGLEDPNDPNHPLASAVYAQEITASGNVAIPKEVFADDYQLYRIAAYKDDQKALGESTTNPGAEWEDLLTLDLNKTDSTYWANTRAVISIGNSDLVGMEVPKILLKETYRDLHPLKLNVVYIGPDMQLKCFEKGFYGYGNLFTVGYFLYHSDLWYHFSHGNDDLWLEAPRQVCYFGNKRVFSHLWSDYDEATRPPGLKKLWRHESSISLRAGVRMSEKPIGVVIFDGCEHGKTNEFPAQLGIFISHQPPGGSVFLGWKCSIPMYDNVVNNKIRGEYGKYRKLMAYSWTRKVSFGSARDNDCKDLLWGTEMRDNWQIVGADAYSSHWCTPNIQETVDHR